MNVTRLQQPPPQSGSTRSVSEAEDITPDFLSIRLVNKRTRVKLSPESLDLSSIPNKGQLFVVAGTLGWFVAIVRSSTGLALVSSPLADLRSQLSSQDVNSDNTFHPQRTIPFSSVSPNYLVFACNDTRLVVGLTQGLVIVFDASAICSTGTNEVTPLHTFLPTTPTPTAVRQMYANPGDIPDLVAILREPDGTPDSQLVEVINVSTLQSVAGWSSGGTPETFPVSISWSPKGKQLAIALQSGDIITFSPSETQQAKTFVARPSSMQGQTIVHTTWLSNPAFYTIFSPVGPLDPQADQKHMVIVHDTKRSDASANITLPISLFPSGVRPPGAFTITLKGWDPTKIFLIIGDSTTADIGLVCCTADDKWQKLSLDESAPSMPLDADQNETTMIGFELDLKNTTPYDITTSTGETVSVPPPPVVWAYASDGTVIAWYLVNTRGTPYPGMGQLAVRSPVVAPAAAAVPSSGPFSQAPRPTFGQSSQSNFGLPTLSGQPASSFGSTPSFGQSGFGQTSTTGSVFAQAPTFGNPAFGAVSPAFTSPPGQAPSGGAFAAFAPASVNWGQIGPVPPPQIQPAESTESMATDSSQELSFGAMSLSGSTDDPHAKAGPDTISMFGVPTPPSQPGPSPAATSTTGSGSFALSPGVGFAKFASKPVDATAPANVEVPKPSPAFGQTSFGTGFGQPGFGQSGFGKTGLGTPMSTTPVATPINPTSSSTFGSGGGFGAFASGGLATFGGAKPAETKPATPAISPSGGFGAFASTGLSAFGQVASNKQDSVPAWKTRGDATFNSGTGTTVFGGTPSAPPLAPATTPVKSMFTSTDPTATTTPTASPLGVTPTPEKEKSSPFADATLPIPPSTAASGPLPTTLPQMAAKPSATPTSTTPVGTPPAANAFAGLKMSTGFGLSNFNAQNSPFGNPKPVSQAVSAFGDPSAPKVPVPATPGSVFGQTSVIGAASKPSPGFAQPAFSSPSTPSASPSATPTGSKTASNNAFSAFSGGASAFGKIGGSEVTFSDMLRAGGSLPDSNKLARQSHEAREKRSKTRPTPPVDVEGLARTIRESEREIEQLELARGEDRATIRELEIGVFKAKTRKEEITRFDKAQSDVEFGKMLKSRFLSPEQTELQTQLRRNIRSIQDRVTKLEDHLQASKKKVSEFKTGRPSIKPPSFDTINRTSRNIDLAIRQQTVDVSALSARVAKLNLDSGSTLGTPSRIRERDVVRRPLDVTPHVASTTAAALNAEQSAHRLKEALLTVRTEPLLNTQAAHAKPAPRAFDTPQKPTVDPTPSASASKGFSTPFTLPPLSAGTGPSASPPASAGRRGGTQKYHSKSVPLKSAPTGGTPPKPSFDWGPLPGIKPMTTLSSDLRSKTG
ncbi:hypothetical protein EDB85DRAFT_1965294 [Lactarius pseudohatsudake]|nr:hypothetical protein EDB85DRAFT_1965294 [Lactarius pseudohatsudake]